MLLYREQEDFSPNVRFISRYINNNYGVLDIYNIHTNDFVSVTLDFRHKKAAQ